VNPSSNILAKEFWEEVLLFSNVIIPVVGESPLGNMDFSRPVEIPARQVNAQGTHYTDPVYRGTVSRVQSASNTGKHANSTGCSPALISSPTRSSA
jgi:hypothetical protein